MGLRERVLQKARVPEEIVEIPELGERFLVRGLTARQRNELYASMPQDTSGRIKPEAISALEAQIIIMCVLDPETQQPVFQPADRDAIMQLPGNIVAKLSEAAFRLSGMEARAREQEKNG